MAEKTLEQMKEAVAEIRAKMAAAAREAGRDPAAVQLCAACKTRTAQTVAASATLPIDVFGENHVQELCANFDAGAYCGKPSHFIGHLQTNKIKKVLGRASLIQSVDSELQLAAIEREAAKAGLVQNILLEVNIGGEESKSGVSPEQLLLSRGLGFLPGGIVDQHFNRRARLQRLLAAMEDADENEGFGISEDTALEVSLSDRALRVHGSAYVMHLTRSGGTITIKKLTAAQHAVQ